MWCLEHDACAGLKCFLQEGYSAKIMFWPGDFQRLWLVWMVTAGGNQYSGFELKSIIAKTRRRVNVPSRGFCSAMSSLPLCFTVEILAALHWIVYW